MTASAPLRILIAAEHASARFGGEASLPLHYFRVLKRRGFDVHLLTHARTRDELRLLYGDDPAIRYIEDTRLHRWLWRTGSRLPPRLAYVTTGFVSRLSTQLAQRRIARALVEEAGIDVVHQPIPVSPREPSALHGLGAPVVIGPMNGNMSYPEAFRKQQGASSRLVDRLRPMAALVHRLLPGKLRAAVLVVANARTRAGLPEASTARVVELVENGVDLSLFQPVPEGSEATPAAGLPATVRFVFMGRLVDWKRVDLLLEAFALASAAARLPLALDIIGSGAEERGLRARAERLGLANVAFVGWLDQRACAERLALSDVLVLPSIFECGGAVVLEAMSMAKPVIAVAWGGPVDYLDAGCGILVAPDGEEAVIRGLAAAMGTLAHDADLRRALGRQGRNRVHRRYDWEVKVDAMLDIYRSVVAAAPPRRAA